MQERRLDGSYGEPIPFDKDKMEQLLKDPNVSHVEVFDGVEEELKRRTELANLEQKEVNRKKNKQQPPPFNRKKRKVKNKLQRKSRKRKK